MNVSCWCGAPIDGAGRYLCRTCESALVRNLRRAPSMIEDLEVEVTRQAVKACSPGTASGSSVGFDVYASELRDNVNAALVGLEKTACGRAMNTATVVQRVHRILGNMPALLRDPSVTGWHADLDEFLRRVQTKIDRPAERVELGACTCGAGLVVPKGQEVVRCRFCGETHDVAAALEVRRERVLDEMAGAYLPVRELVDALRLLGFHVKSRTVASWADRGKLTPAAGGPVRTGRRGRPSQRWSLEDAVERAEHATRYAGCNAA